MNSDRHHGKQPPGEEPYWLYGMHPVRAALANPRRRIRRLLATRNAAQTLAESRRAEDAPGIEPEIVERKAIDRLVPPDAVHQGVALLVDPIADIHLDSLLEDEATRIVLVLDQVTDPHNVGAILRSAAAFGAAAVITTWRHSPPETAVLVKAAAGAFEAMPYIRIQNLAGLLEKLHEHDFLSIGLDAGGPVLMRDAPHGERTALVLGAEGKGLRHLTRELCGMLARLPISEQVESLNVSNAAAVALYELTREN
ncbi:23S rRNA (guanosine(2251)-2'-O)-methyltransferase RlmB [Emcibacter sp. SYSU 3D8]|uniref:23S rRNA (guanosine(2251)-2'-O)-methyltransferase RlmB n=1 Tax=Emcibacter sp. SYSU 3D8 TaxID=3133969 RepID=UPI0031FF36E5